MTSREASPRHIRCAVYTRKSSEEGLDQAFNSLDAQREAGIDYIKSQKHQGWTLVPTMYDDGGYSGGSTERPGLKLLLQDIERGRIDIVLVYKVDRLSRSLADFARLMQVFDEHRVSFVSVTQQFNTTTSMGRLTLNMLLSFAQFEREVAGERIRDKIAATRKKGVWVCGRPPLGYRLPVPGEKGLVPGDRTLQIVESEATIVRTIFKEYLAVGSLLGVATKLNQGGLGRRREGAGPGPRMAFTAAYVHRVLVNPVYIGKVTHTRRASEASHGRDAEKVTSVYDAAHTPVIERAIWDRVRARMDRDRTQARHQWSHTHLLKGKLRTFEDHAMSPASVQRPMFKGAAAIKNGVKHPGKRLIRYYISQKALRSGYKSCPIKNINAEHIDNLVRAVVLDHLRSVHSVDLRPLEVGARDHWIREVVRSVIVAPELLTVELDHDCIAACAETVGGIGRSTSSTSQEHAGIPTCPFAVDVEVRGSTSVLSLRMQIKRLDGKRLMLSPDGHDLLTTIRGDGSNVSRAHLVQAIGTAFAWHDELLQTGVSIQDLAKKYGQTDSRVHWLLALTNLAPDIIGAVFKGEVSGRVSLDDLLTAGEHLDWGVQRRGMAGR
jgi:DNA invertase Pin-like site-specific DNA recombinase